MTSTPTFPGRLSQHRDDDFAPKVSPFALERAAFAAHRAAQARRDLDVQSEGERLEAERGAELSAVLETAGRAAGRAAVWVPELAARTGDRYLAEFAAAVLACGRDLDPGDGETGGVPAESTLALDGFVLLTDGLSSHEGLALAAVGAIALAMPRTITCGCPATQLPQLADRLDQAVATGRAAT